MMKMTKKKKCPHIETDNTLHYVNWIVTALFALWVGGMFAILDSNMSNLSDRIDRLESDNALQQKMITELGKKAAQR
jgi:hypothetical protein